MKTSRGITGVMLAAVVATGIVMGSAAPAMAGNECGALVWSTAGNITIQNVGGSTGPLCYKVQAKMLRYYGGTVHTLLGPESGTASSVSSSNGSNSGNYVRWRATGYPYTSWVHAPF